MSSNIDNIIDREKIKKLGFKTKEGISVLLIMAGTKISDWLSEHCEGDHIYDYQDDCIYFQFEEDAVKFTLRFGTY